MKIKLPIRFLKAAALFVSKDATRYVLTGIQVEINDKRVVVAATDGRAMFAASPGGEASIAEKNDGCEQVIVPVELIARVPNGAGDVTLSTAVELVQIETYEGMSFACGPIVGNFPQWRMCMPKPAGKAGRITLNGRLLAPFMAADKILGGNGAVVLEQSDKMSGILIRGAETMAEWIGVQMPMLNGGGALPSWV